LFKEPPRFKVSLDCIIVYHIAKYLIFRYAWVNSKDDGVRISTGGARIIKMGHVPLDVKVLNL